MTQLTTSSALDRDTGLEQAQAVAADVVLSRRYVGAPGRQVHLLEAGARRPGRPLYCLHATAYSGRSLSPLLQAMGARRRVVALDAPGYGGSDAPAAALDLAGYAHAVDAALDAAGESGIDLFGYHTGALIAAELAGRRPDRVRRLVLIGVPYFSGADQAEWRKRLAQPSWLGEDFEQFRHRWDYLVTHRPPGVSLARGFDNFVDDLRAYPNGWWAHDAAFTFDAEACLARVEQPVLVINPHNHLAEASRRAAHALRDGRLVEAPHLENGVFDVAAAEIGATMDAFLGEP